MNYYRIFRIWGLLLLFSLISCKTISNSYEYNLLTEDDLISYIDSYIIQQMENNNVAGLSVAIVTKEKIFWSKSYGFANKENQIKAKNETVYGAASISKLITATAIMQLYEKGLIDLDAPVTEYIPEFSIKSRSENIGNITVRMLLTHHSGLPRDKASGFFGPTDESFRDMVSSLYNQYLSFPPGKIYSYSNLGYDILGVVIERVSGEKYSEYTTRHILEPLDMSMASFVPISIRDDIDKEYISMAHNAAKTTTFPDYLMRDIPAAGLNANIFDLSKFIMMVLNKGIVHNSRILSEESINEMLTIQNENIELDLDHKMGLGFFLSHGELNYIGKVCGHGGSTLYHYSDLGILPNNDVGVIVFTNTDTGINISSRITSQILKSYYKLKSGVEPKKTMRIIHKKVRLSREKEKNIIGFYNTLYGVFEIYKDRKNLKVNFNNKSFNLVFHEDNWFSLKYHYLGIIPVKIDILDGVYLKFDRIDDLDLVLLQKYDKEIIIFGEKVKSNNIPLEWMKRVGTYEVLNLSNLPDERVNYYRNPTMYKENDCLKISFNNNPGLMIEIINNNIALYNQISSGSRESILVKEINGEEVLEFSGYIFKKI